MINPTIIGPVLKPVSLCCLAALGGSSLATTFYVSPQGTDTNTGSSSTPWRTIQHACKASKSGDTVLVKSGTYNELVTILHSMTLQSAPGAKPIVDGTWLTVPANDAAMVLINGINSVIVQGFEIRNFKTTNSQAIPTGILIEGKADQVVIRGNYVHNIENNGSDAANINAFGIVAYGNSAKGAITHLLIDKNEVSDTKTGNSETVVVNGNVNGFQITNNVVHDTNNIGIDCIGFEGTSPIKGQDQARNGLVAQNTVYNVTSLHNPSYGGSQSADGIYVDGGTAIVIERNIIHHVDLGMEVTSEHLGKVASAVTVRNNQFYACNVVGLSIGGYDAKRGGTLNCTFVNNTFYQDDTTNSGSGEFMVQFHTKGNVFKNNILSASAQGVLISTATGAGVPGVASDYNLFFTSAPASWTWGAPTYSTLATFSKASKGDTHSKFLDPHFVDLIAHDFHLASGSPARKAGTNLGALIVGTLDLAGVSRLAGNTIDLGCFESTVTGP